MSELFNLSITAYNINELKDMLNLDDPFTIEDIVNNENILRENNDIKEHIHKDDKFLNPCNGKPVCQSCNAPNNRIRSAVTLLDKKYYSDTRNYLKSRVKTYQQNLNLSKNLQGGNLKKLISFIKV